MKKMDQKIQLSEEEQVVFNIVQKNGPISKNDIAELSGFKLTSLIRYMRQLERDYLITESEIGESTGGRRPVLYDVSVDRLFLIGIEISRLYVQIVITNLKMEIMQKLRFPMNEFSTPSTIIDKIHTAIHGFYFTLNINEKMILGVGVGTVGPMDRDLGIVINPANFIATGWVNVNLKEALTKKLGLPVFLDNGANTALLAEYYYGIGKNHKNIFYLNCGVGIRSSVISSGKLIRSMNDSEDAFAHMVIDINGMRCRCGSIGCIECYSTIHSITEHASLAIRDTSSQIRKSGEEITFADICIAADAQESPIQEIMEDSAVILGYGISNMIKLLNPGLVIVSGQLIVHSKQFYDICTRVATENCSLLKKNTIKFSRGGLFKENAISIGAAGLVLEHYLNNPLIQ